MIRFLIIGIVLSTLLSSCQEEQPPIPQSEMVNILTDLHMSEAYAQLNPIDKGGYMTKNYDTMLILYSHIFKKHSLDSTSFKTALIWYKQRPDVFDKVYKLYSNYAHSEFISIIQLNEGKMSNHDSFNKETTVTTLNNIRILNCVIMKLFVNKYEFAERKFLEIDEALRYKIDFWNKSGLKN